MVDRIYPTELQLNKTNSSDTEAPFKDLNASLSYGTVCAKNMINWTILILMQSVSVIRITIKHSALVAKPGVSLKKRLQQGISEPKFYDD